MGTNSKTNQHSRSDLLGDKVKEELLYLKDELEEIYPTHQYPKRDYSWLIVLSFVTFISILVAIGCTVQKFSLLEKNDKLRSLWSKARERQIELMIQNNQIVQLVANEQSLSTPVPDNFDIEKEKKKLDREKLEYGVSD